MEPGGDGASSATQGGAIFETHCAQCHGPAGEGGYLGPGVRPPEIGGAAVTKIERQVRAGNDHMPALSTAVLSDAALASLGTYVHDTLSRPSEEPSGIGPRALDPLVLGLLVWGALALFVCALALAFGGGRN